MNFFTRDRDKGIDFDKADPEALNKLDKARGIAGIPFIVSSSHRTPEHSVDVGGLNNDAHTEEPCTAFDVKFDNTEQAYLIAGAAFKAGFGRIGINPINKHVHMDDSTKLPTPRLWIEGVLK